MLPTVSWFFGPSMLPKVMCTWLGDCEKLRFRTKPTPFWSSILAHWQVYAIANVPQPTGFEPVRAEPNGFRVHRLNHSATTALPSDGKVNVAQLLVVLQLLVSSAKKSLSYPILIPPGRRLLGNRLGSQRAAHIDWRTDTIHCKTCAVGRIRTCAGRAQWISSPSP